MTLRPLRSLRARLFLVAVVALLPLLGYFLYSRSQLRRVATEEVRQSALHRASVVAREYESALLDTRTLLTTLAKIPEVGPGHPEACSRILAEAVRDRPYRSAIGVIEEDGYARCVAPDPGSPVDLRDRPYVEEARRAGETVFSTYHSGRATGTPVIVAAHPLRGPDGRIRAVLAGGIQFAAVSPISERDELPEATTVTIVDREGTVLFRQPDGAEVPGVGDLLPRALRDSLPETGGSSVFRVSDVDGGPRIVGASALAPGGGEPAAFVLVGFSSSALLARVGRLSNSMLLGLILATITVLGGIAAIVEFVFLRKLRPVLAASERLGRGDWTARTGIGEGDDELSRLARTFDRMAENLERQRAEESARAREEIREREMRLQQVAEAADELFWLFDPRIDEFLYLSPSYERIFAVSAERLKADPASWMQSVHPDDRAEVRAGGRARRRGAWESEYRIVLPEGTVRWIHHRTYPIRNHQGRVYRIAGVAEDVTDRKRLEETLHQAGKLEAVGRLAGGVAHDFNNVLTAIRGHVQLLLADMEEDDPIRADLEEVDRSAERAVGLTRQLLAFSRKQTLRPTVVRASRVVKDLSNLLGRILGEDVTLQIRVDSGVPPIRVDRNQLEQALVNLAANARDAMPTGGRLRIAVEYVHLDAESIPDGREAMDPGRWVRIAVEDEGEGMDGEVLDHVFEPFYTTKRVGKGTGLGLAGVYGFVKQSGGFIWVDSVLGEGTRFEICLPPAPGAVVEDEDADPGDTRIATQAGGSETVLVVENEESVRSVIRRILRLYGYQVLEASGTREARDIFRRMKEGVDLVVSAVELPEIGGHELARELRAMDADLRVLLVSDSKMEGAGRATDELPLLEKPFSPEELTRRVREILDAPAPAGTT